MGSQRASLQLRWNNCVYVCWISDRVTQWQSMQVSTGLPSLSPSLPPSLMSWLALLLLGHHSNMNLVKKCARSQCNNTVTAAAAAIITLLLLTAGTYHIQSGVDQSLDDTRPHGIQYLCWIHKQLFWNWQKIQAGSVLILPTYNLVCAIGWAGVYLTKQYVH